MKGIRLLFLLSMAWALFLCPFVHSGYSVQVCSVVRQYGTHFMPMIGAYRDRLLYCSPMVVTAVLLGICGYASFFVLKKKQNRPVQQNQPMQRGFKNILVRRQEPLSQNQQDHREEQGKQVQKVIVKRQEQQGDSIDSVYQYSGTCDGDTITAVFGSIDRDNPRKYEASQESWEIKEDMVEAPQIVAKKEYIHAQKQGIEMVEDSLFFNVEYERLILFLDSWNTDEN